MYTTQQGGDILLRIDVANDALKAAVFGLSEAQSNFKPSAGAWSVAGIVEHLAIVQERVIGRIDQLLASTLESAQAGAGAFTDEILIQKVVDRSAKFPAPEVAHPKGNCLQDSLDRLAAGRKRVGEIVASAPPDFQQRSVLHPAFGPLDCHQWLVALAGHCVRHTEQIVETKGASSFPAN
jgi:DinB superfamily